MFFLFKNFIFKQRSNQETLLESEDIGRGMLGVVGGYGCGQRCGFCERVLDDVFDDGNRSCLDLVGQLLFDEIEFDGLGAMAGPLLFLLPATAGVLLGRGAMAKNGEVGRKGQQQQEGYDPRFLHLVTKVMWKYKKSL
jgi:hypothetical protein